MNATNKIGLTALDIFLLAHVNQVAVQRLKGY